MDKLTDEEREALKVLLSKGIRTEPKNEIGIGFGHAKVWVKDVSLITFMFMVYIVVSLYMFWEFKKETMEAHRILQEGQTEQAFLLTLTPEQRTALGIQMPESLLRKLYNQNQHEKDLSRRYK